jgi:hypothetical protein
MTDIGSEVVMRHQSSWHTNNWSSIEIAPPGVDLLLLVTDGVGEPYALKHPFKMSGDMWVHSKKGTALKVRPLKWRFKYERTTKALPVASEA